MAQLGWRDGAHSGPESRHLEEVGIVQKRNDLIELDFFQSWHSFYFKTPSQLNTDGAIVSSEGALYDDDLL